MVKRNKLAAIVMVLVFNLICSTAFADAQNDDVHERYIQITRMHCGLNINDGTAECIAVCQARDSYTDTGVKLTLKKRAEGSSIWHTVATWSDTQHGKTAVRINDVKSVSRGYYYQLHIRCTITDANGAILESGNKYSDVVKYI